MYQAVPSLLQDLPHPTPVICGIPDQEFSDFMTVLEFVNIFWEILELKDVYPQGITFEMLESALVEKEVAGERFLVTVILVMGVADSSVICKVSLVG